jgi:asparagine synthase (glutamine-hydrolysing)
MPGIVGLITANPDQVSAKSHLSRMLRTMLHEASYSHGTYCLPEQGIYLGWVSHKGSYADCNPIVDQTGDVVLVFSGEHFAHNGGSSANGNGSAAKGANASALLKLYEDKGLAFVGELNGWFSGVLVDRRRQSVVLFNDRFGVHRIYCHESTDTFTFASEAKSILSVRPETRAFDPQGLGHFLGFGSVFENRTLFAGISLVPAGSSWTINGPSAIDKRQYFHPRTWAEQPPLDAASFYSALLETVSGVLPAYFRSTVPVGLSLTGGLDTRIVMAGRPAKAEPMPSYTYAGVSRECFDVRVARQVATTCGEPYHVLGLGPDFFENFDEFAEQTIWLTDGYLSLCSSHEIYYSRLARQLSPVRLTGNYGSEVLRSHSTFKYRPPPQALFDPAVLTSVGQAAESFADIRADHPVTFAAFKEVPWHLFGMWSLAQSQLVLRSPYMDNDLVALLYRAPPNSRETKETSRRLIADMNPRLAAIPTDMGYMGDTVAPVATVRRWHRYAQFKAEWYYSFGMPQWLARFDRALPLRLSEPLFLGSHKIANYRLWFQNELMDYVQSTLSDARAASRPYLNREGYAALVSAHSSGRRNCVNELDRVLTLELINRLLFERDYGA